MKTVKTPKGTELPIVQMKGKDYLPVAQRVQWFNEVENSFTIETNIIKSDKDESVVQSKVSVYNEQGRLIKSAVATKHEDSKGFGDHLEKAETGATGRALALLGYGTQFAVSDLDEGERIVDAPQTGFRNNVSPVKTGFVKALPPTVQTLTVNEEKAAPVATPAVSTGFSSFRKPATTNG